MKILPFIIAYWSLLVLDLFLEKQMMVMISIRDKIVFRLLLLRLWDFDQEFSLSWFLPFSSLSWYRFFFFFFFFNFPLPSFSFSFICSKSLPTAIKPVSYQAFSFQAFLACRSSNFVATTLRITRPKIFYNEGILDKILGQRVGGLA